MILSRPTPAVQVVLAVLLYGGALRVQRVPATGETGYAAAAGSPTDTVGGWVVDANDWLDHGFLGVRHRQSALNNADLGTPLVILTDRGSIVYPVTMTSPTGPMVDNVRLIPFAEQRVIVSGKVITRGGERGVVIEKVARAPGAEALKSFPSRETAGFRLVARVADLSSWLSNCDSCAADGRRAQARAEDGDPLVLVTDSGCIYYPVVRDTTTNPPDFTTLIRHFEQMVVATGTVITRGRARAIVIHDVAAYEPRTEQETLRPEK
jgi:hypothetical protein